MRRCGKREFANVRRTAMLLLVIAAQSACSSTFEPSSTAVNLSVSAATLTNPQSPPAPSVVVSQGTVAVTGYLGTPTTCYDLTASNQVAGDTLVLRVSAISNASACAQVVGAFRFVATVTGVPSSVTRVRVEQSGAVAGTPQVLLDQAVVVP